jgi:hypothetical protein
VVAWSAGVIVVQEQAAVIEELFHECASDVRKQRVMFADFQRVMAATDFHVKLRLPI